MCTVQSAARLEPEADEPQLRQSSTGCTTRRAQVHGRRRFSRRFLLLTSCRKYANFSIARFHNCLNCQSLDVINYPS